MVKSTPSHFLYINNYISDTNQCRAKTIYTNRNPEQYHYWQAQYTAIAKIIISCSKTQRAVR
jgi:hypothetical protein